MNENEMGFELRVLRDSRYDFQARYMAVANLKKQAGNSPESITAECYQTVADILDNEHCNGERQSLCYYQEAALFFRVLFTCGEQYSDQALATLTSMLKTTDGKVQRAVAETLGSLTVAIPTPAVVLKEPANVSCITFAELVDQEGVAVGGSVRFYGRSTVVPIREGKNILVLKFARNRSDCLNLVREAVWMEHLRRSDYDFGVRFDIPQPVTVNGERIYEIDEVPASFIPTILADQKQRFVMAYRAHGNYFTYPNEQEGHDGGLSEDLPETIGRNAYLLGRLMGCGLVHTAPIPLFHNRIQQARRDDHGLYDWPQAGRLDRWLESCSYPNIGDTGVRDFEHFETFSHVDQSLYWYIGNHIISLLLVIGSCFRNREKELIGFDENGRAIDARRLFDKRILKAIVRKAFEGYYYGFVGAAYDDELPFDLERLAGRMIEEMGVDTHMEEVLRQYDQQQMSDDQFAAFLFEHDFSERDMQAVQRGQQNLMVHTGPHLGGFNQGISLIELIEAAAAASATCIVGRYRKERSMKE